MFCGSLYLDKKKWSGEGQAIIMEIRWFCGTWEQDGKSAHLTPTCSMYGTHTSAWKTCLDTLRSCKL